jgi:hypothetical protein
MFRHYLQRIYQNPASGRKWRAPRLTRTSRQTVARLTVEGLEERTLMSVLVLNNGALSYLPSTTLANSLSISHSLNPTRYTITDTAEIIVFDGPFIDRSGEFTHTVTFRDNNISSVTVNMFNQNFTVNIEQTVYGQPVTINLGGGTDTVNLSPTAHKMDDIRGLVTIHPGLGFDSLNVNDQSSSAERTLISANAVARITSPFHPYPWQVNYGGMNAVTVNGGSHNDYDIDSTQSGCNTTLNTGAARDYVYVKSTGFLGSTLNLNAGPGGMEAHLGYQPVPFYNTLDNLHGTINVNGLIQGVDTLTLHDGAGGSGKTYTVTSNAITWTGGATVNYNNWIDHIYLAGGGGATTFNVLGTGAPTEVGASGASLVNVGNNGSLQQINRNLVIRNDGASLATVNIDDSADGIFRTATLQTVTLYGASYGQISGLLTSPFAAIAYDYGHTNSVNVQTGFGGATVNVKATGSPVTLIGNANGTVNVGDAGSLQAIASSLTITDPPNSAFVTVNVDDSADPNPRTATVDTVTIGGLQYGRITGLTTQAAAVIQYKYADTTSVSIMTGMGGAVLNVMAILKPIALTGSPTGGSVTLVGPNTDNTWNLSSPNAGTLSSALFASTVTFSNVQNLTGGSGADNFVFADGAGVDGTINGGGGTNTLDYSAYSNSSVIVDLQLPTGIASGVGGVAGATIQNVIGGNFNGDAGLYNLLIGNGLNTLTGGTGRRNILVAGGAASTLNGGDQEDLLIAGTTNYDGDPALTAWGQIAAEWASSDEFAMRIMKLGTGSGVPLLDPTTVSGNGGGNTLKGTGARAWIFSHDELDTISNFDPNSPIVKING